MRNPFKPKVTPWTLEQGLATIRAIQLPSRNYGYHVCMGGGVLNTGASDKDLDVYLLPMGNPHLPEPQPDRALGWLEGLWGPATPLVGDDYPVDPKTLHVYAVRFLLPSGQRIDLFILGEVA